MADDALLTRIAKLEAMNEHLLQRVVELGIEVQRSRAGGFRSMRDSRRCPACGEGSLVHVRRVHQAGVTGLIDVGVSMSWSSWRGAKPHGGIESYSCRSCGLVEYHVVDWKGVHADGTDVVSLAPDDEPPSDGPFR